MQSVWLGIHIVGALVSLGLLISIAYRENTEYKMPLMLTIVCAIVALVAKSLYIASDNLYEMIGLAKMEYLGKCYANYFALSFILKFRKIKFPEIIMKIFVFLNTVFFGVIATCTHHTLYYRSISLAQKRVGTVLKVEPGILYYAYMALIITEMLVYVVVCAQSIIQDYRYKNTPKGMRGLHYSLIIAGLAPAILLIVRVMGLTGGDDVIPLGIFVAVIFLVIAVNRFGLFDPVQNAKDSIVENMNEAIIVVDNSMNCYYINELAVKFFPELCGKKGVPKNSSVANLYRKAGEIVDLDGRHYEIRISNLQKKTVWSSRMHLVSAVDVTNLMAQNRKMQELKETAERADRVKSTFLANMSHEIRTPMNAIVGITDILLRDDLPNQERRDYLENIKSSGNALLSLINGILDFSKIESGKMELNEVNYDLFHLVRELDVLFRTRTDKKNLEFGFDVDDDVPQWLYGDEIRLRQIIINIVNNAIKFTEVGSVRVHIRLAQLQEEDVELHIAVKDTGRGIHEKDKEKMFEMFSQVDKSLNYKMEGTGLGLSISKELVELMGGTISVNSQYGKGSEFYFTVHQRLAKEEELTMTEGTTRAFTAPKATVLLVDDNRINLKVAEGLLAPLRMKIDTAEDGMSAIHKVEEKHYDIIFMDHMMPTMDGVETTRRIRKLEGEYYKNVPIVALTANAVTGIREELLEQGLDDFVAKPIDLQEICDIIVNWLPKELIQYESDEDEQQIEGELPDIEGLDVEEAVANCGSLEMFLDVLGDFYTLIPQKASQIKKCLEDHMLRDFTIEVHALKNSARLIGAMELSEQCFMLEQLGNAQDEESLQAETPAMLERYQSYIPILRPYGEVNEKNKVETSNDQLIQILERLYSAMDQFDLDTADEAMKELEKYKMPAVCRDHMELLRVYMADVAMQDVLNITQQMMDILQRMAEV